MRWDKKYVQDVCFTCLKSDVVIGPNSDQSYGAFDNVKHASSTCFLSHLKVPPVNVLNNNRSYTIKKSSNAILGFGDLSKWLNKPFWVIFWRFGLSRLIRRRALSWASVRIFLSEYGWSSGWSSSGYMMETVIKPDNIFQSISYKK